MLSSTQLRKKAKLEAAKLLASVNNTNNVTNTYNSNNDNINNSNNTINSDNINNNNIDNNSNDNKNIGTDIIIDSNESDDYEEVFFEDGFEEIDCTGDDNDTVEFSLTDKLGKWAVNNNITNSALNELLLLLNECDISVPKDARTVKKTPKNVEQKKVREGVYVHYGIKAALTDILYVHNVESDCLVLDFNIDGLPLYKSSSKQVWPILGSLVDTTYVFLVGVFEGISKPHCADEFLEDFNSELIHLMNNGIVFGNRKLDIKVRCFVMDAPARSFILGTKGHSGYFSCVKCTQKGEMVKNRLGGVDGPSFLRGGMKHIFTDELCTKYSWKGTKEKPSAELCYCVHLLKDVCYAKYKLDDGVMNSILQKHFVHAQDRINKKFKIPPKKQRKENENPEAK